MTPEFYFASAFFAALSALPVGVLGALSLAGGRARPRGALVFGLFSLLWAVQIIAGNAATLVLSASAASTLYLLSSALLLVLPYFLVEFALSQLPCVSTPWQVARGAVALVTGLGALLLVFSPSLLYNGVVGQAGQFYPDYGPLYPYLIQAPIFLGFALAVVALHRATTSAATPRVAHRAWFLLAGLGLYTSYAGATYLVQFLFAPAATGLPLTTGEKVLTAAFAILSACVAVVAVRHARAARSAGHADVARLHRGLALALAIPMAWGVTEAVLVLTRTPYLQTVGLWRLAGVAVIAYGIARWRIYDLPQRTSSAAVNVAGATAATATGAAVYGAAAVASASVAVPVAAGVVVLAATLVPSIRFARKLFGIESRAARPDLESALYGQRIDAYRAALEASLARGTLEEDREFLAALRERFGITEPEERVLLHYARSSVIVARDRQAFDAYERLRLLGEGGAGRTWLARDRARDRLVVLKEPLPHWQQEPSAREAVLREARMAARVRHPNVVAVEEVVEGKGSPVIVMEYLEGGSLSDLLRARGTLPWADAKALILDVLRGVEAVHAAGVVHRDIKPSNILLDADGVAKVADFGIAVAAGGSSQRTIVMDTPLSSTIAGTLAYMAPEARAGAPPDRRADVYACAAILHECLYSAPPGLRAPVVVRHDLPAGLASVLAAALADDPAARPASARAFAELLVPL